MNIRLSLAVLLLLNLSRWTSGQKLRNGDCKCRLGVSKRIVGGGEVAPHSVPWQVSLAMNGNHICGGTILNHNVIMTAAHCVANLKGSDVSRLTVRVGLHELNDRNIRSKTYVAQRVFSDPRYGRGTQGDFALIEVKGSIPFSKEVQPACLPARTEDYNRNGLLAVGWGSTVTVVETPRGKTPSKISPVLKGANLNYVKCESHLVCVKPIKPRDSICFGDSGSGLQYPKAGTPYTEVVGVAQFVLGHKNRNGNMEYCTGDGAYSRVSYNLPLVQKVVGGNYCKLS